jgi:hypothetical protein
MSLTTVQTGMLGSPQYYGFKNRLINSAMVIDQRSSGAAQTSVAGGVYCVDRWRTGGSFNTGRFTIQQNLNSITPPANFVKYSGVTTTTAESPPSASYIYAFVQWIEGVNVADLGWGTSSAQTVTLSFWARSSLTGTFAGDITNGAQDRSYVFTYSLPTANTWTFCTVTIPGPTTGTWTSDNSAGVGVRFSLGTGSTYLTSSTNQWLTGQYEGATGQTNVVSTNGATWYMTGAQFELGSSATIFDTRPYTTELQLCQRYLCGFNLDRQGAVNNALSCAYGFAVQNNQMRTGFYFPVQTRVPPTGITTSGISNFNYYNGVASGTCTGVNPVYATNNQCTLNWDFTSPTLTVATGGFIYAAANPVPWFYLTGMEL